MDSKKTELFETMSIPKAVANLSVPSVLSTLVMVLYNFADTLFVGMLGLTVETAAVTLASPILLAFNAINNLFGIGASSMMSRCLGRKDPEKAKKTAAFAFWLAFLCAALISVVYLCFSTPVLNLLGADDKTREATKNYLFWTTACGALPAILNVVLSNMVRSEGEAIHASIGVISGCLINIVLDPFFVLENFLGLKAAGAGLATFIANCCSMLYLVTVIIIKRKKTIVCLNPLKFRFKKDIAGEVFGVGVPAALQNLLNVTGMLILNNLMVAAVADPVERAAAVSGMGIAHKINMLPLFLSMGVSQGIMPLISYNYSSGDSGRMKKAVSFVVKLSVVLSVLTLIVYHLSAEFIIRMFIRDELTVKIGARLLREMSLCVPFLSLDFAAVGVFQATGKGKYSLVFAILRKIVLEIPAIYILNLILPLYGLGYAQPFSEVILGIAAVFILKKIIKEAEIPPEERKDAKKKLKTA